MGQAIKTSNPNNHPHENESLWTKVKHSKEAKSSRTDHGSNTVSGTHEATQNLSDVQQNNNTGISQPSGTRDTNINRNHTKDFRSSHQQTEARTKQHIVLIKPINGENCQNQQGLHLIPFPVRLSKICRTTSNHS